MWQMILKQTLRKRGLRMACSVFCPVLSIKRMQVSCTSHHKATQGSSADMFSMSSAWCCKLPAALAASLESFRESLKQVEAQLRLMSCLGCYESSH